jgi:hypothetical protein
VDIDMRDAERLGEGEGRVEVQVRVQRVTETGTCNGEQNREKNQGVADWMIDIMIHNGRKFSVLSL